MCLTGKRWGREPGFHFESSDPNVGAGTFGWSLGLLHLHQNFYFWKQPLGSWWWQRSCNEKKVLWSVGLSSRNALKRTSRLITASQSVPQLSVFVSESNSWIKLSAGVRKVSICHQNNGYSERPKISTARGEYFITSFYGSELLPQLKAAKSFALRMLKGMLAFWICVVCPPHTSFINMSGWKVSESSSTSMLHKTKQINFKKKCTEQTTSESTRLPLQPHPGKKILETVLTETPVWSDVIRALGLVEFACKYVPNNLDQK